MFTIDNAERNIAPADELGEFIERNIDVTKDSMNGLEMTDAVSLTPEAGSTSADRLNNVLNSPFSLASVGEAKAIIAIKKIADSLIGDIVVC